MPQIYWGFENTYSPFDEVLPKWNSLVTADGVDLIVGLQIYKAAGDLGWRVNPIAINRFQGKMADGLAQLNPDGCIVDCSQLRSMLDIRPFRRYPLALWRHLNPQQPLR